MAFIVSATLPVRRRLIRDVLLPPRVVLSVAVTRDGKLLVSTKGDGEVHFILMLSDGGEVEVRLPGRYKVSPQIAGAIKAVPGVVTVEAG